VTTPRTHDEEKIPIADGWEGRMENVRIFQEGEKYILLWTDSETGEDVYLGPFDTPQEAEVELQAARKREDEATAARGQS
jgi:hypothetical protein